MSNAGHLKTLTEPKLFKKDEPENMRFRVGPERRQLGIWSRPEAGAIEQMTSRSRTEKFRWKSDYQSFQIGQPRTLFVYFHSFQKIFYRKIKDFSGVQTWIVWIDG